MKSIRAALRRPIAASAALLGMLLMPSLALAQDANAATFQDVQSNIDLLWVLISTAMVFLMQAGFLAFETGAVRRKNIAAQALKNVGDWVMATLVFFLVGYGVMFGASASGFFGSNHFLGMDLGDGSTLDSRWEWTKMLFQLAFAGTAATIVSGAMAERVTFKAYLVFTVAMGGLIYPVYGHWAWNPDGWLAKMGYIDFAGSSVVHLTGGVAALVGCYLIGPRLGRYGKDGTMTKLEVNSAAWSALGVIILWFGWWGFNGGSTLRFDGSVVPIIMNTNIAGASGAIVGYFHCRVLQRGQDIGEKFMGSAISGLVAVTAGCHLISPFGAFAIGAVAAIVHNHTFDLILRRLRLDDVVAAIPVHGFCGFWGILAIPLFAKPGTLPAGGIGPQLLVQFIGATACVVWTGLSTFLVVKTIQKTIGLRVPPMVEIRGLSLDEDGQMEDEADEEGLFSDVHASNVGYRAGADDY